MSRRARRGLWVILALGFGVRLAWALYAGGEVPTQWFRSGDQYSYYYYGNEIAHGRGYLSYISGEPTAYNPIGYPALLGALYFMVLHTPIPDDLMLATALFHVALGTATVGLVFVIGRAVAGTRAGLLGAAVFALWPNAVFMGPTLLLEPSFTFFTMAAVAVAVTHDWAAGLPTRSRLAVLGGVLGVSVLIRPFSVWLLLGLLLATRVAEATWKRAAAVTAVPALIVIAMMVPWTLRNLEAMDAFVPSSTNMGDTLCIDRFAGARGGFHIADHEGCVDPSLGEVARNQGNTRKAISFVVNNPDREALQILRRARFMLRDDHFALDETQNLGGDDALPATLVEDLKPIADGYWFAVLAVSAIGVVILARRRAHRAAILIVGCTGVSLTLVPLLLWGNARFHSPMMPFMAVATGVVVAAVVDRAARARA